MRFSPRTVGTTINWTLVLIGILLIGTRFLSFGTITTVTLLIGTGLVAFELTRILRIFSSLPHNVTDGHVRMFFRRNRARKWFPVKEIRRGIVLLSRAEPHLHNF